MWSFKTWYNFDDINFLLSFCINVKVDRSNTDVCHKDITFTCNRLGSTIDTILLFYSVGKDIF